MNDTTDPNTSEARQSNGQPDEQADNQSNGQMAGGVSVAPCIIIRRRRQTADGRQVDDVVCLSPHDRSAYLLIADPIPLKLSEEEAREITADMDRQRESVMAKMRLMGMTDEMPPQMPPPGAAGLFVPRR